jgi:2-methylcitrate dehydratase
LKLGELPLSIDPARGVVDRERAVESAFEAAHYWLLHSITCGLQALTHAACLHAIRPVVPGATMARGARVPGTSYDLDPVQAAFGIGTMLHWRDHSDPLQRAERNRPAVALGGILAVADYLSRKAIADGQAALTMRDVLRSMLLAHSVQRMASVGVADADVDGGSVDRVATTAVVTSLLGGTEAQVTTAVSAVFGAGQSRLLTGRWPGSSGWPGPWAMGEATSCGVRIALLAVNDALGTPPAPSPRVTAMARAVLEGAEPDGVPLAGEEVTESGVRTLQRFGASVAAHFPATQAKKIQALCTDPARLGGTAVHDFGAALVRN